MYRPQHFAEDRPDVLQALLCAHPLATLVTHDAQGLQAQHVPLLWLPGATPPGVLQGHVARGNALAQSAPDTEVLAIFQGPDAYVSPSWYPSKAEHGRAVPTWNYVVVHAHGRLRCVHDRVWLRTHLQALTAQHEARFAPPWQLSDAPADYLEAMMAAVVGIELTITRLVGKCKVSQNQSAANRAGVVQGLGAQGHATMAQLVAQGGALA